MKTASEVSGELKTFSSTAKETEDDIDGIMFDSCSNSFEAIAYQSAYFGQGDGPIVLGDVACSGREAAIQACPADVLGANTTCGHLSDAGVSCVSEYVSEDANFREIVHKEPALTASALVQQVH